MSTLGRTLGRAVTRQVLILNARIKCGFCIRFVFGDLPVYFSLHKHLEYVLLLFIRTSVSPLQ
jgi:hypothetical protein